jgi:DnaJ-class molecular chaperone
MGAYPPGCTQADHDRAFADETRERCPYCEGTGHFLIVDGEVECPECAGTGYEPIADTRENDAYDQAREDADSDIEF